MIKSSFVKKEASPHIPVLLDEVIENISPKEGLVYIDATFGAGGYTKALLDSSNCKVYAIDRDPNVVKKASDFKEKYQDRFELVEGCFGDIKELLEERNISKVDGVVFDIGVSSMQIDNPQRGFSFNKKGPLDMRMSQEGLSASDVVNGFEKEDIADILYKYGEEKKSRLIAKKIVEKRKEKPFETTLELAELIEKTIRNKGEKIHPATRTFQALRIFVNKELEELEKGLQGAFELLDEDGILAVVTFHSLEDRIVKRFINKKAGKVPNPSRYMPINYQNVNSSMDIITRKPIVAKQEELEINPRSRSAKLRVAKKKEQKK